MDSGKVSTRTKGPTKVEQKSTIHIDWYEWVSLCIIAMATLFFCVHQNYDVNVSIANDIWGQFGDFIGGVLGTFVAYVGIKLLVKTLNAQYKSNEILTQSNYEMARVYKSQQFETNFKTLWEMYNNSIKMYSTEGAQGRQAFPVFIEEMQHKYDGYSEAAIIFNDTFYIPNRNVASVHFRVIYQVFVLIATSNIEENEKIHYAKMMRSQFHEDELLLLRYNCNCSYGRKMQTYVNQYNLLKHTPIMKLLEFAKWKSKLSPCQINRLDTSFIIWKKYIKNVILDSLVGDEKKYIERISERYTIRFKITSSLQEFELQLDKSTKKKSKENNDSLDQTLDKFDDSELQSLMDSFLKEVFINSNFGLYNSSENINFIPDIITKKNDGMVSVVIKVQKKDYPIIISQQQLSNPIEVCRT